MSVKVNHIKTTLLIIPLAIVLTYCIRLLLSVLLLQVGFPLYREITLVIYLLVFVGLKIYFERQVRDGKYQWFADQ